MIVLGIVDPVVSRAQSVLEEKKEVVGYEKTAIWSSIDEYQGQS